MLFSSISFIYIFLPALLFIHFIFGKKYHNFILLLASILFYALGEMKYIPLLFGIILINYLGALLISKFQNRKKFLFIITIALNISFLVYFKYFNFLINNINNLFHFNITIPEIILPIGISFYTFQAMSYLTDVYRNEVKAEKNLYNIALYICLFPQLIAGPIIKYHDIKDQIISREINLDKVSLGIKRFISGLAKKVLIANTLGIMADEIFEISPEYLSQSETWLGALCYTCQIFYDFSGYSDMAIGLGLIFGFTFMENFNYPYISKSITEIWHRWHISLATWFKQYVYIPLGGNKKSKSRTIINLLFVFLLTGIWHGAGWTFIFWGLWNGIFIVFEKIINIKELEAKYQQWYIKVIQHIYCLLTFIIGLIIFRADDLKYAYKYILNMFGILQPIQDEISYSMYYFLGLKECIIIIIAVLCATPVFKNIINVKNKTAYFMVNLWFIILFLLSTIFIAGTTYNPFIYFRF